MPTALNSFRDRSIGAILVDSGRLSVADAERVLRLQREKSLQFGEAALQLGVLRESDIQFALASQYNYSYIHKSDSKLSPELIAAYAPFSPQVENLRGLRSQLMLRYFSDDKETKTLAIVSPERGEGRSYLAANLAIVFSQLGEQTLLIDADLRNPRQHELFGLRNRTGLSTVLSGRGNLEDMNRISGLINLSVMTSGPTPPNPQELLGREDFNDLLRDSALNFDVVIIDTPASNRYADAQSIAVLAKGAIVAVRKNETAAKSLETCAKAITELGVPIIGSVLVNF